MNQSAAALSGSFAPADRFKNLEIRKDFQTAIWNDPPLLTALVISSEIPWIFDIFQIPDSILPYYGHSGKGLSKTEDYSCKTARFSMCKLPSAFPIDPPEAARFAPSSAILQSPNFIKKVRKTPFFIFPAVPYQAGKKRTATQLFETCAADLLLDDFHAVGVQFLLALFADGSLRS